MRPWLASSAGVDGSSLGLGALLPRIAALLYSVQPRDPFVIGGAALILLLSAVIAAAVPARRAAGVDPTRALRN